MRWLGSDETPEAVALEPAEFATDVARAFDLTFTGVEGAAVSAAKVLIPKSAVNAPGLLMFHGYSGNSGDWLGVIRPVGPLKASSWRRSTCAARQVDPPIPVGTAERPITGTSYAVRATGQTDCCTGASTSTACASPVSSPHFPRSTPAGSAQSAVVKAAGSPSRAQLSSLRSLESPRFSRSSAIGLGSGSLTWPSRPTTVCGSICAPRPDARAQRRVLPHDGLHRCPTSLAADQRRGLDGNGPHGHDLPPLNRVRRI